MITKSVALFMLAISGIFWVMTVLDYKKAGGKWTVPAKVYRRTALVFAVIGTGHLLFGLIFRN